MYNEDLYSLSDIKMKMLRRSGWARLGEIINEYNFCGKTPGKGELQRCNCRCKCKVKMLYMESDFHHFCSNHCTVMRHNNIKTRVRRLQDRAASSYISVVNSTRCTISQIYFILEQYSTCFGRSVRPSSGV